MTNNDWRDKPYATWKNWHSWEAANWVCAADYGVFQGCCDLIKRLGKEPTPRNVDQFKYFVAEWISSNNPSVDIFEVDWKRIYSNVANDWVEWD